jgi:hypothetical protein
MPPRKRGKKRKKIGEAEGPSPHENDECQQPPPPSCGEGPSVEASATAEEIAVGLLCQHSGVAIERARHALKRTEKPESKLQIETWVEDAMTWLAVDAECGHEANEIGEAMRISLQEAEALKASEKPLQERSAQELREHFDNSFLLSSLQCAGSEDFVLELLAVHSPIRKLLTDFMVFERRCAKWWPSSQMWFKKSAEEAANLVEEGIDKDGIQEDHQDDIAVKQASSRVQSSIKDPPDPPQDADAPNANAAGSLGLVKYLNEQLALLRQQVYALPQDGDMNAVPDIFRGLEEWKEEVVLLE